MSILCLSCHWYRGYYVTTRHVMLEQQFKMHHFHYAYREHSVSSILGQLSHGVESPISWPNHVFHVLELNRASSVELPVADDCRENEWPLVWDEGTWQVAAQSKVTKWQQNLTNTGPSHQYSQTQHHNYFLQDTCHEACNFVSSKWRLCICYTADSLSPWCHLLHGDLWIFSFAVKAEEQEQLQKHLVRYKNLWIHTEKK